MKPSTNMPSLGVFKSPEWPTELPYRPSPRASFKRRPGVSDVDALYLDHAARTAKRSSHVKATAITGTYNEAFFTNTSDFTAVANTSSESSLLAQASNPKQPVIPANHFLNAGSAGRGIEILAQGILSTTSTPTIIFQVRFGATAGSSYLSGTSVGVSAAITTSSGVSNKWWFLFLRLICNNAGVGTGNGTLSGAGYVSSPGGFASPFVYPLEPSTPDTATWTSTFDAALTQYVNLSVTWSAASASNTITCKQLVCSAFG